MGGKESSVPTLAPPTPPAQAPQPLYSSSYVDTGNNGAYRTYKDQYGNARFQYLPTAQEIQRNNELSQRSDVLRGQIGLANTKMNYFSPQFNADMEKTNKAFLDSNINQFNDLYDPQVRATREDSSRRFGTDQNTMYQDNMDRLDKIKANALGEIVNQGQLQKQDIINNEMNRRQQSLANLMSEKQMLATDQQGDIGNIQNMYKLGLLGSSSLNDFNSNIWNSTNNLNMQAWQPMYQGAMDNYKLGVENAQAKRNALMGMMGQLGGSALGSLSKL
jgi:hypothetical protein